jgi:hypothetical protein
MLTLIRATCLLAIAAGSLFAACGDDASGAGADSQGGHGGGSGKGQAGLGGAHADAGKDALAGHSGAAGQNGAAGHAGAAGAAIGGKGAGGNAANGGRGNPGGAGAAGSDGAYTGPSVASAKQFAVLAYDSITSANTTTVTGSIGVSAAALSVITGFDDPQVAKFGDDSLAPNDGLTGAAQGDVTSLVGDIDPRACDDDLTDVVGGLTGDVTLHPGVTCMNSFSADVLIDGHVYLDAGGDPNAFFIVRANKTLTLADGAQIVLTNDANACGVFWRVSEAVTVGKNVALQGTLIAGTAITMKTGSSLNGRALAQTAGVQLDANTITAPTDAECPHPQ